ncbi:MAG: primosomal protein N' [Lachnospiraceae bacterium]|nr:primosomal protein N' [Lachnospiraceae bacterium]
MYADVYIDISHKALDRVFQYRIPDSLKDEVRPGTPVRVNFGKGNKIVNAYCVGLSEHTDYPEDKIKDILGVNERGVSAFDKTIELAAWMQEEYGSTFIKCLNTVMPAKAVVKPRKKQMIILNVGKDEAYDHLALCIKKKHTAKERLLRELIVNIKLDKELVVQKLLVSASAITSLKNSGIIRIEEYDGTSGESVDTNQKSYIVDSSDNDSSVNNSLDNDFSNNDSSVNNSLDNDFSNNDSSVNNSLDNDFSNNYSLINNSSNNASSISEFSYSSNQPVSLNYKQKISLNHGQPVYCPNEQQISLSHEQQISPSHEQQISPSHNQQISPNHDQQISLTHDQRFIVNDILSDYDKGILKPALIHGITGSGKTLCYIELCLEMVKRGKACIVLIPEIALTYQTLMRFYKAFNERVSVINSTLSKGEIYERCEKARAGLIDVIIGPRSALFTPFNDIGLIIIDEEHETSYKSDMAPKYNAKDVAKKIADLHKAKVVFGSATPSLDSYLHVVRNEYKLYELLERPTGGELPDVYVVDMREELKNGNRSMFSEPLDCLIKDRLLKKEQIMLFLNRRGYVGFVSCRSCGKVIKCPHCDVSLTKHITGKMICHYCGYTENVPNVCPDCGSRYIGGFKAGTQQIEEKLKERYPGVRVLRMDKDTTAKKGEMTKILSSFADKEADILVGTQMIVKGHDFPNVTLVGILAADMSLGVNDYSAAERTFDLLCQAVGRAGRGTKKGEALIQTYDPDHYAIVASAKQDYKSFFKEEAAYRELCEYPPYVHLLGVQLLGRDDERTKALANDLACMVKFKVRVKVLGPSSCMIGKINDIYRYVFYIKSKESELINLSRKLVEERMKGSKENVSVFFDLDPTGSL